MGQKIELSALERAYVASVNDQASTLIAMANDAAGKLRSTAIRLLCDEHGLQPASATLSATTLEGEREAVAPG